jgi:long-chain acyl-CoA synthetase
MNLTPADLRRTSAPALLARRAQAEPQGIAYRAKRLGLYEERTWSEYARRVAQVAHGLKSLGLQPGERVAIMGDACDGWMLADLGAQAAGAITYGIYPTASAAELEYQMTDGGASIFIAEDQEYVDRILPLADRLPNLRRIVVLDASALFAYRHRLLATFDDVVAAGGDRSVDDLAALAHDLDPASSAFIVYTSGTSGHPKGALVSHGRHLAATFNLVEHYPTLAERPHRTVAYLPICHILGRDIAVTLPLLSKLVPHFGEDVEDLPRTFFEIAPTVLFTVPRFLQKFASQILVSIGSTTPLKRAAYEAATKLGRSQARRRWEGGSADSLAYRFARTLVFRPLLEKLGLDRLELAISGGAPLPRETMALWHMWGVNVLEIYGQTETAGAIISGQKGPFARPGNVGTVPAGWEVKLADDGEILTRSEDLFEGYWNHPQASADAFTADGWLRTGDIGEWRDGALCIVDRARDFLVTSGGKTLSPSFIENRLRASPYVTEAMVIGHARKYVTALIEIDFDAVADWARANDVSYTGFTSLAMHPAVARLIEAEVARANGELSRVEQVKAFRILPKALDPEEEGEPVTPTRKLKRTQMLERFRTLVESMYDDREEQLVATGIGDALNA